METVNTKLTKTDKLSKRRVFLEEKRSKIDQEIKEIDTLIANENANKINKLLTGNNITIQELEKIIQQSREKNNE